MLKLDRVRIRHAEANTVNVRMGILYLQINRYVDQNMTRTTT